MEAYLKYYYLLELPQEATFEEISKSYSYLKALYSGDPIEITALNADFSQELLQDYLCRLDEAYEALKALLENNKPTVKQTTVVIDSELSDWIKGINCFTGSSLRSVRERMGVDLKEMFAVTRIQPQYLEDIENEIFESFKAEAYLRSYVIEYTRFLSLDTGSVLTDYMPRYRSWAANQKI